MTREFVFNDRKYAFGKLHNNCANIVLFGQTSSFLEDLTATINSYALLNDLKDKDMKDRMDLWDAMDGLLIKRTVKAQFEEQGYRYKTTYPLQMLDVMAFYEVSKTYQPLVTVEDFETTNLNAERLDELVDIHSKEDPDFFVNLLTKVWLCRLGQYKTNIPEMLKKKISEARMLAPQELQNLFQA